MLEQLQTQQRKKGMRSLREEAEERGTVKTLGRAHSGMHRTQSNVDHHEPGNVQLDVGAISILFVNRRSSKQWCFWRRGVDDHRP
jgi:hypothetical protein